MQSETLLQKHSQWSFPYTERICSELKKSGKSLKYELGLS